MERWIVVIFISILTGLSLILLSCEMQKGKNPGWNRGNYLKRLDKTGKRYGLNPNNKQIRLEYAKELFETGEFSKSEEILNPLLIGGNPPEDAIFLKAFNDYLHGHYCEAEKEFGLLYEKSAGQMKIKAQVGLLFIYYQTKQYGKSGDLFRGLEGKIRLALWDLMKSFGDEKPYQVEWKDENRAVIPFILTEPLPVIPVVINGKQINAIIDTGGDIFYLDDAVAGSLGIKPVAMQVESGYAGGKSAESGYGRVDSLSVGNVTMKAVPVKIMPIRKFSGEFGGNIVIGGILTTGVLQQFLATVDYPGGRLILRPRNTESVNDLKKEFLKEKQVEMPFVLAITHLMICKGSVNGMDGLNIFLDSGLASDAALLLPKQTMDYIGLRIPPVKVDPDMIGGGGGGGFPVGSFEVKNFSLGSLKRDNLKGLYGVFPPQIYYDDQSGFIIDGLISHQFLKRYRWTIDFDSMKMIFSCKE